MSAWENFLAEIFFIGFGTKTPWLDMNMSGGTGGQTGLCSCCRPSPTLRTLGCCPRQPVTELGKLSTEKTTIFNRLFSVRSVWVTPEALKFWCEWNAEKSADERPKPGEVLRWFKPTEVRLQVGGSKQTVPPISAALSAPLCCFRPCRNPGSRNQTR